MVNGGSPAAVNTGMNTGVPTVLNSWLLTVMNTGCGPGRFGHGQECISQAGALRRKAGTAVNRITVNG